MTRSVSIAVLVTSALAAVTAASELPFRHYRTADGLPQSQVLTLHQDRRGEIWVGTWCGSARFDGATFRTLSQRHGLPSNYVREIVEDASGDLWFAVGDGTARVDPEHPDRVAEVHDPLLGGPDGSPVRDLLLGGDGRLWAATKHHGAAVRSEGGWTQVPAPEVETDGFQLLAESEGRILLGTLQGLVTLEEGRPGRPWRDDPGPWSEAIRMLGVHEGAVVFGTADSVWSVEGDGGATELRTIEGASIPSAVSSLLHTSGELWIATESGLYRRVDGTFERLGRTEGLAAEHLYRLAEDREGNLWIGHEAGASRFSGETFRTYLPDDGLPSGAIWSLAIDGRGDLLVGTSRGVAVGRNGRFEPLVIHDLGTDVPERSDLIVRAIGLGTDGAIVLGTRDAGALRIRGAHQSRLVPPDLPDSRVFTAAGTEGAVWLGTRRGLARWNDDDSVDVWTRENGLPHDTVWAIGSSPAGETTVATDRGLAVLRGDSFEVPPVFERFGELATRNFVHRRDGSLWVGTNGAGIHVLDEGSWTVLRAGDGPSDDFVWGMLEDRAGRMWVATNHGIDVFDGARWINTSGRDGLRSDEIAVNAAVADPSGAVWFGFASDGGLVRFSPKPPGAGSELPPLVRVVAVETGDGRRHEATDRIQVPWDRRDLTIHSIGVSFLDERRVRYRTRLVGYDDAWSPETDRRRIRYTNLEPGEYRFEVLAMSAAGVWNETPAMLDIEILPPFWSTWWFRTLMLLGAAVLLVTGFRFQVRRLESERRRLEQLVRLRTESLERQIEETERVKESYRELSITDPLTGLSNRRFFVEQLERELARARRHGETLGLLLIDVDHFKRVNDEHGHLAGDHVLRDLAETLRTLVRTTDLAARYGGEEFVLVFLSAEADGIRTKAESVAAEIRARRAIFEGTAIRITISGGLCIRDFSDDPAPTSLDELLRSADEALYRAKSAGRDRIVEG